MHPKTWRFATRGQSLELASERFTARPSRRDLRFVFLSEVALGNPVAVRLGREVLASQQLSRARRGADPGPPPDELERRLSELFEAGFLSIRQVNERRIRVEPMEQAVLGPAPPAAAESEPTNFEVAFVDHTGKGISGLTVLLTAPGVREEKTTDGSGVARFDGIDSNFATARVKDSSALEDILAPRFAENQPGSVPLEPEQTRLMFVGEVPDVALVSKLRHTVILGPELAKLELELFDKTGRVRHANCKYKLSGPESFEGTTDEQGRLLHSDVTPGDYQLELEVIAFDGADEIVRTYKSPVVALPSPAAAQVRMLGAVPRLVMARMRGMLFETNKSMLLPTAISALRELRKLYTENDPSKLLIVGHTDTTGEPAVNDPLSVERAQMVQAYLKDEVQPWLDKYGTSIPINRRWGRREDLLMIGAMPDFKERQPGENPIRWFQTKRELTVDGVAGPKTRTQLITEYMALDGVTLAEGPDNPFQIEISTHGAGENFPVDDGGAELDAAPENDKRDRKDRRAELFFFDAEFGIVPAPGSASGPEYEKWRERADIRDFFVEPPDDVDSHLAVVEVEDGMFNLDSAVVLPEAERPSGSTHEALTSVGVFATALVYAQSNPRRRLLVAGHTDTSGSEGHNQELSEERAKSALCCLEGTSVEGRRDEFVSLSDARHKVRDYKQILSWAARSFGFACDPGVIDDNASTAVGAVKGFQTDYNARRAELGVPDAEELDVDGSVGPKTWGAIFDCYEAALAKEVSAKPTAQQRAAELNELRSVLLFVDSEQKSLGFGEHHTIEKIGQDNVRSQENRRVELLFFVESANPDLTLPPADSEIYLPGVFQRESIPVPESAIDALATLSKVSYRLRSNSGAIVLKNVDYTLDVDGRILQGKTDADGLIDEKRLPPGDYTLQMNGKQTLLGTLPPDFAPPVFIFEGFMLNDGLNEGLEG